jgi:glycosyltransferase involved in cell wall biosynthesis
VWAPRLRELTTAFVRIIKPQPIGHEMNKILVVGQTPPPYHGQAIMIKRMLEASYPNAKLYHVRMGFSDEIDEVGKFRVRKICHLLQLILNTYCARLRRNVTVLYYPPAGPALVPVLRDIVFLIAVRWLFRTIIFDFHAAGLSEFYKNSTGLLRRLMEAAYFNPDVTIGASPQAAEDGRLLGARREFLIPNGIEDFGHHVLARTKRGAASLGGLTILYVGALREDKGILVLLEAVRLLRRRGREAYVQLVGHFFSVEFEREVRRFLDQNGLADIVRLRGVLTGDDKWRAFSEADLFCFPSHFAAESFPVCLVEALSFSLPVVATRWRGIPNIVSDGENGFLVSIRDAPAVADRLERLITDSALREAMGRAARAKFEQEFTVARYHDRVAAVFESIVRPTRSAEATPAR